MTKETEKEILEYIDKSESYWTNIVPFIAKSECTNTEFYTILKSLIEDGIIADKKDSRISDLCISVKGKPIRIGNLFFRITDKGQSRLRNDLYNPTHEPIKIYKATNSTKKGSTSILQNFYWIIGIIVFFTVIHTFLKSEFNFNVFHWIFNK